ncbi:MAG: hypothetical protein ACTJGY_13560, partial [Glutamicibacter arilaitensis]|uniref:hypothetical protein n=1 Tax=Glutamicibacter arilaitensis TaxID=256701 RepID=UPI003FD287C8
GFPGQDQVFRHTLLPIAQKFLPLRPTAACFPAASESETTSHLLDRCFFTSIICAALLSFLAEIVLS